jgi:HAD superfamily hydrolase (TIGR01459 family)
VTGAFAPPLPVIDGIREFSRSYAAIFCDVWGVLYNGAGHFPHAAEALHRYRVRGGYVALVTNASRPDAEVRRQLVDAGLPENCFDDLVSAGELTLREIIARGNAACFHLGPARDDGLFAAASARTGKAVRRVDADEADYIVCTGLYDEISEKPEDYDPLLAPLAARGLEMLCANPDIVVANGDRLVYCAGALAERYLALGGRATMYGKPWPPIYDEALARARRARGDLPPTGILAIGDGAFTDLAGAGRAGLDCLFVTGGVHASELLNEAGTVDPDGLARLIARAGARPVALVREVFW